jgi:hypothetical protein
MGFSLCRDRVLFLHPIRSPAREPYAIDHLRPTRSARRWGCAGAMAGIRLYTEGVLVSGPAYGMQGVGELQQPLAFSVPLHV